MQVLRGLGTVGNWKVDRKRKLHAINKDICVLVRNKLVVGRQALGSVCHPRRGGEREH